MNSLNRFGVNPSLYWMKYQMMMKQPNALGNFRNLSAGNPDSSLNESVNSSVSEGDHEVAERMVGRLTASERKQKVDKYLQK